MVNNLIIGSEGYIGMPFCKFLEDKGEDVMRFDIKRSKTEDARITKIDFKQIDKVYFLAWDVGGSKYLSDKNFQMSQLKWNLQLMSNVFEQIEKWRGPFLFVSSRLAEDCDTVYGVTKRMGEVWTTLLKGVSVRLHNVYGTMQEQDIKSFVIPDFINQALQTGSIQMLTDGEEWRQFIHIDDLSNAMYLALKTSKLTRTVYDVGDYEWIRIKDVAQIICELTGATLIPGNKKGYDYTSSNMGKLPGWSPKVELKDGIKRMVELAKETMKNESHK